MIYGNYKQPMKYVKAPPPDSMSNIIQFPKIKTVPRGRREQLFSQTYKYNDMLNYS